MLWIALATLPSVAAAAPLPAHLDLEQPFPHVTLQAPEIEPIAPGVQYGDYELWTDVGPISVHVVAADLRDPAVRVGAALSHDALTSAGETVTSMAQRARAVAGINGDYFDIGRTNRPTNIVVRDGTLLRSPRKRYAIAILRDGSVHFSEFELHASVQIGAQSFALDAVDELAGDDGIALLTPAFGPVPQVPGLTLTSLTPTTGTPPFATYRVDAFAQSADGEQPPGYYLATGNAVSADALPNAGDAITIAGTLAPIGLDAIAQAIGGGPLILYDGTWYDDPDGPSGGEFSQRIPCSGVALEPDGTLLLIEVDGREPQRSVGLTRPEFAALMHALGATDGMALDGGGSSTLAAQLLGEDEATLQNAPSDGVERPVADGLLVFNAAPAGPPARLVSSPQVVRALAGAEIPLRVAAIDANDHPAAQSAPVTATVEPASLGTVSGDRFVARAPGVGWIRLRAGELVGNVPIEVAAAPDRVVVLPPNPNLDPSGSLTLRARAFDSAGFEIALPARLPWKASSGTIDDLGHFVAGNGDADVTLDLGGRETTDRVTVGSHEAVLDVTSALAFRTFPAGGAGSASPGESCGQCIRLQYALGETERAAYAVVEQPLPDGAVGIAFDLQDDGSGAELRVALRNAIDEQVLVTATALTQPGRRHVVVRFPPGIAQPARLVGFYTLATAAAPNASGTIVISNVRVLVAGTR